MSTSKQYSSSTSSQQYSRQLYNRTSSPQTGSCTNEGCTSGDSEHMLTCAKCKRPTHFVCTRLPAYQIFMFIKKEEKKVIGKKQRKYVCPECCGVVPPEFVRNSIEGSDSKAWSSTTKVTRQQGNKPLHQPMDAFDALKAEYASLTRKYKDLMEHNQETITKLARTKKYLTESTWKDIDSVEDKHGSGKDHVSAYSKSNATVGESKAFVPVSTRTKIKAYDASPEQSVGGRTDVRPGEVADDNRDKTSWRKSTKHVKVLEDTVGITEDEKTKRWHSSSSHTKEPARDEQIKRKRRQTITNQEVVRDDKMESTQNERTCRCKMCLSDIERGELAKDEKTSRTISSIIEREEPVKDQKSVRTISSTIEREEHLKDQKRQIRSIREVPSEHKHEELSKENLSKFDPEKFNKRLSIEYNDYHPLGSTRNGLENAQLNQKLKDSLLSRSRGPSSEAINRVGLNDTSQVISKKGESIYSRREKQEGLMKTKQYSSSVDVTSYGESKDSVSTSSASSRRTYDKAVTKGDETSKEDTSSQIVDKIISKKIGLLKSDRSVSMIDCSDYASSLAEKRESVHTSRTSTTSKSERLERDNKTVCINLGEKHRSASQAQGSASTKVISKKGESIYTRGEKQERLGRTKQYSSSVDVTSHTENKYSVSTSSASSRRTYDEAVTKEDEMSKEGTKTSSQIVDKVMSKKIGLLKSDRSISMTDCSDYAFSMKPYNIIRTYSQRSFVPPSHLGGENEDILALQMKTGRALSTISNLAQRL